MRQCEPIRKPRQHEIDPEFNDKTGSYFHEELVLRKGRAPTTKTIARTTVIA
jgi:hypothetical protein